MTRASNRSKAPRPAQATPANGEQKRKTSPLIVVLVALVALGACLACVWFGGKALLERWDPFNFLTPTATPAPSQSSTVASARQVIGPDGGTLALNTGVKLVFPAGAVGAKTEVVVTQLDAAQFVDENTEAVLLDCSAGVATFDKPVEIRVPLPDWFTPEMADAVMAGVWNEETETVELEPSTVVMTEVGKPELVIEAYHFSWRIIEWWKKNYGPPPHQGGPLEIPYYSQSGGYCWATTLHMLNEAARHSQVSEIFSIIGTVGIDDSGLGARAARTYPSIGGFMSALTGVWPERYLWLEGTDSALRTYIRRQIANLGHPVGLVFGKHAWVFVGYDGTTFYVMDPQGQDGDIYKRGTWEKLGLTNDEDKTSVVVPKDLAADRPLITINIKHESLAFVKPKTATAADLIRFRWDHTRRDTGYSWFSQRLNAPLDRIPGEVSTLQVVVGGDGVEIANAHRDGGAVSVSVVVDIRSKGPNKTSYSTQATVDVEPGKMVELSIPDIPVDAFRDFSPSPVEYSLRVRAVVGGSTVDDAAVTFVLDPTGTPTPTASATVGPTATETTIPAGGTTGGEWVLQAILPYLQKMAEGPCYFGHQASLGDGSFATAGSWTDKGCVEGGSASGSVHCSCTWTGPASYLKVGSTLSMELSCRATANQTGGRRSFAAQGWVWYTLNPPENALEGRFSKSRKFLGDVIAQGWTDQFPVSDAKSGSVEVPAGKKGDVLVVVVDLSGQGGFGKMVYKYAYHGTDPVPPRGVPAEGLTPQAPTPTATATATPEPTETPEPEGIEEPQVTPTDPYGAGERELWAITDIHKVYNGAGVPTRFMLTRSHLITRIRTYHWNNGKGVEPGWIALRSDDGMMYGPWQAVGKDGSGGVPNAYWEVTPNVVIPVGIYTVLDSDPETWSQNEGTGGRGMSWGYGIPRD